jgi:hypothetical protein
MEHSFSLKVHDLVHKSTQLATALSRINPFHIFPPYVFMIHFSFYLHLFLGLGSDLFPQAFPSQFSYVFPFCPWRSVFTAHFMLPDLTARTIFGVQYKQH